MELLNSQAVVPFLCLTSSSSVGAVIPSGEQGFQCWLLKHVATLSTCGLSGQREQVFHSDTEGEALEQCTQEMINQRFGLFALA